MGLYRIYDAVCIKFMRRIEAPDGADLAAIHNSHGNGPMARNRPQPRERCQGRYVAAQPELR